MLQDEFDPCRRSLRQQFFLPTGVAPCKNQLSLAIWATIIYPKQTCSKHGIQVQYVRNPSSGQYMKPSRRGIWTQNLKFEISHVYLPIWYMCVYFSQGFKSISSSKSKNNKIFTSCPNFINSSIQSCFLHTSGWSKQMLMIVSSNALEMKSGLKTCVTLYPCLKPHLTACHSNTCVRQR